MIKIIHLSDIHILNTERHDEYRIIFEKLYKYLDNPNTYIISTYINQISTDISTISIHMSIDRDDIVYEIDNG
jgi:hypothetical protein